MAALLSSVGHFQTAKPMKSYTTSVNHDLFYSASLHSSGFEMYDHNRHTLASKTSGHRQISVSTSVIQTENNSYLPGFRIGQNDANNDHLQKSPFSRSQQNPLGFDTRTSVNPLKSVSCNSSSQNSGQNGDYKQNSSYQQVLPPFPVETSLCRSSSAEKYSLSNDRNQDDRNIKIPQNQFLKAEDYKFKNKNATDPGFKCKNCSHNFIVTSHSQQEAVLNFTKEQRVFLESTLYLIDNSDTLSLVKDSQTKQQKCQALSNPSSNAEVKYTIENSTIATNSKPAMKKKRIKGRALAHHSMHSSVEAAWVKKCLHRRNEGLASKPHFQTPICVACFETGKPTNYSSKLRPDSTTTPNDFPLHKNSTGRVEVLSDIVVAKTKTISDSEINANTCSEVNSSDQRKPSLNELVGSRSSEAQSLEKIQRDSSEEKEPLINQETVEEKMGEDISLQQNTDAEPSFHELLQMTGATQEEKVKGYENGMESILESLYNIFSRAVSRAYPGVPDAPVPLTTSGAEQFGDYQCNAALRITQILKSQGVKTSPRDVATCIKDKLGESELIDKVEIAGPGFLNIWISRPYCQALLSKILTKGVLPPRLLHKKRVIVDFSSPNIAKEMHVGHLRSTIIGDSTARLLEYLGHDVERVNHVGDWGTQFGMLIAHLQDNHPEYRTFLPSISHLQSLYKESKMRFDTEEAFKKRAYESVVQLQAFNPEFMKDWQLICDVSRKENQVVYDRLNISLTEKGESFYQTRMEELVKDLKQRGLLEEDEQRYIMWGLNKELIPFTIVKADGGFTYDTSDLACIRYRIQECKADWIIYVVDTGQATHFEVLKSCAQKAGYLDPAKVRVDFVGFGVVLGEDKKKFKTRSGETVRLTNLLDEGLKKALDTLKAKGRDQALIPEELKEAQEAVAYGCIKYADLSHNRVNDYVFSFNKMLEDKGNTAVYLLYAYTRICSIARAANITVPQLEEAIWKASVAIDHDKEWKLAKVLLRFPDVLSRITKDLLLHTLCDYVYEIASTFTEFYDNCYCIDRDSSGEVKEVHMDRLLLIEATARVMKQCFNILGLKTVSRM